MTEGFRNLSYSFARQMPGRDWLIAPPKGELTDKGVVDKYREAHKGGKGDRALKEFWQNKRVGFIAAGSGLETIFLFLLVTQYSLAALKVLAFPSLRARFRFQLYQGTMKNHWNNSSRDMVNFPSPEVFSSRLDASKIYYRSNRI